MSYMCLQTFGWFKKKQYTIKLSKLSVSKNNNFLDLVLPLLINMIFNHKSFKMP